MSYTITVGFNGKPTGRAPRDTESMQFRLLDDDEEIYFQGMASDDHAILAALDRATDSYGCTLAQWRTPSGKWEALN